VVGLSAELDVIKDFDLSGVDFLTPRRGVNFIGGLFKGLGEVFFALPKLGLVGVFFQPNCKSANQVAILTGDSQDNGLSFGLVNLWHFSFR